MLDWQPTEESVSVMETFDNTTYLSLNQTKEISQQEGSVVLEVGFLTIFGMAIILGNSLVVIAIVKQPSLQVSSHCVIFLLEYQYGLHYRCGLYYQTFQHSQKRILIDKNIGLSRM